ncbi:MAG: hypothetical protein Q8S43_07955 [Actinomycetota bacterium]|nr:MAG: hypothetical protein FD171_825 [Actinomycetota bacterium]MDO8949660.1 hypothetical protein [Actinomycetota bacterium]MDP3630868.1 hypothetical protein [Actinomycetota bacterium]
MAQYSPFASFAPLGFNVAGIMFNMVAVAFFAVVAIGIGFLVYAAKQLKKRETAADE